MKAGGQLRRFAVKRSLIAAVTLSRAVQFDLEIPGEQPVGSSIIGHRHRDKTLLEKSTRRCIIAGCQRLCRRAERPPIADSPEISALSADRKRCGIRSDGKTGA